MNLRLTDGTTTVNLNDLVSPNNGATYFPAPPDTDKEGWAETVTETAEVTLLGTASAIRSYVNSLERLFESARQRLETHAGARLYVEYQAVTGDDYYRSEILYGRLVWSENPAARRLSDTTVRAQIAIHWTRRHFWEGALTQLSLTSSANGTPTTSAVTLYSNDDATPSQTNWIGIANTQVGGTLPAPLKLELAQGDATARAWRTFYLANNVYSNPTAMDPFLLGSEAVGGAAASWTPSSDHSNTLRWVWLLPASQLADLAGRYWRVIVALDPDGDGDWYLKPWVTAAVSGVYQTLWEGDEVYISGATNLYDLGALPIPPGGYDAGKANVALNFSVRDAAAGGGTVDFVQFTPTRPGMFRKVTQLGFSISQNDALVDDGPEGLLYFQAAGDGHHELIYRGENEPLHVWPGITQRLRVLVTGSSFTAGWSLKARAWYRPRRLTV